MHAITQAKVNSLMEEALKIRGFDWIVELADRVGKESGRSYSVYVTEAGVTLDVQGVKEMKESRAVRQALRSGGIPPMIRFQDFPQYANRDWFYPNLKLSFWLEKGTASCSYVQIGTETIEKPIYELRCTDGAKPVPPALEATTLEAEQQDEVAGVLWLVNSQEM